MSETFDSHNLTDLMRRIHEGDKAAQNQLIRAVIERLEVVARRMLKKFPSVRRWEQTTDVLQQALLRLLRSLEQVEVANTQEFFSLAAVHIRRVLIDLARHYQGPQGLGANHASGMKQSPAGSEMAFDPEDRGNDREELARWEDFHLAVEKLPTAERETFNLIFYHGWTQVQVAELFSVDERTVRRRWHSACLKLNEMLGGRLPLE